MQLKNKKKNSRDIDSEHGTQALRDRIAVCCIRWEADGREGMKDGKKKLLIPRKEKRHKFELNLIKWETIAHKDQLRHLLFLTHNFFSS